MHARRARGLATAAWTLALTILAGASSVANLACGGSHKPPLAKAGADRDEGAGNLARASQRLQSGAETEEPSAFVDRSRRSSRWESTYPYAYGGAIYGGAPYGGSIYGGATYASWVVPQWTYSPPSRMPRYNVLGNLSGSIEGSVTWVGAPPAKVTTPCGSIDHPTLHVGTDKAARGVIVYIEKVAVGRAVPYYTRPVSVGGTVAKRGCAFAPAAQVVAPLPSSLTVHGDDTRTKLELTIDEIQPAKKSGGTILGTLAGTDDAFDPDDPDDVAARPQSGMAKGAPTKKTTTATHDLQEGGFVQIEAKQGVTRIEAADRKVSPAWVIGIETPYYAITDDRGRYRIDELAPGTYEVTFWQAPVATLSPAGTWTYGPPIVVRRSVKVGGKTTQLSVSLR